MRPLYRTLLPTALLTFLFLVTATTTRADTLTFSTLEQAGTNIVHIGDPYFESGYKIQDSGELYYWQQSNVQYAGSAGLHERISNGLIILSRQDGAAFKLTSIDLSTLHPQGISPAVVFVGVLQGGGTVTQTFTPTVFGFHTFVFNSSFTNLLSVSWHQGNDDFNAHQFDNVVVNSVTSVPEPATMLLFGSGLVGVAGTLRKRRKARPESVE